MNRFIRWHYMGAKNLEDKVTIYKNSIVTESKCYLGNLYNVNFFSVHKLIMESSGSCNSLPDSLPSLEEVDYDSIAMNDNNASGLDSLDMFDLSSNQNIRSGTQVSCQSYDDNRLRELSREERRAMGRQNYYRSERHRNNSPTSGGVVGRDIFDLLSSNIIERQNDNNERNPLLVLGSPTINIYMGMDGLSKTVANNVINVAIKELQNHGVEVTKVASHMGTNIISCKFT